MPRGLPALFRGLLPPGVTMACMDPRSADPAGLHALELLQISNAVESRRREYAAGRLLARVLLRERGWTGGPLLNGPDRSPQWPAGIVGSITHCAAMCAVAIGSQDDLGGLGIDLEPAVALPDEIAVHVVSADEASCMDGLPSPLRTLAPKLVFCAKEAAYKALYPRLQRFLDFGDLHVVLRGDGTFHVVPCTPVAAGAAPFEGRWRVEHGYVIAAVALPHA